VIKFSFHLIPPRNRKNHYKIIKKMKLPSRL
jgi:hypothetical protein